MTDEEHWTKPSVLSVVKFPWLLLALIAFLPYVNSLFNTFVWDDDTQVLHNPAIRSFKYLIPIFTKSAWWYQGGAIGITNYYRPLMTFGYLLCYKTFGFHALGYHAVNVALNVGVVLMLFVVSRRIFQDSRLAFLAAALFALHPVHSEDVDWIAAVTDLELGLFFLISFWCFLVSAPGRAGEGCSRRPMRIAGNAPRTISLQCGMAVSFVLALLAKEPAATLPFLATFYEHTCRPDRRETSWSVKLSRYAVLWVLLAVYLLLRVRILGGLAAIPIRPGMQYNAVFFSAVALMAQYFHVMVWPVHLSAFHPFPNSIGRLLPSFLAGSLAVALSAALFIYFWGRDRRLSFALLWFYITLAPVLNARWMPMNVFAERYLYLPSMGLCWLAAWVAFKLPARRKWLRRAAVAAAVVLACLLGARIYARNRVWKDDLVFFTTALAESPNSASVATDLGIYNLDHGNLKSARRYFLKAYQLLPRVSWTLDNVGTIDVKEGEFQEGAVYYERSLALAPRDVFAHVGLGNAYEGMGKVAEAEDELQKALALAPLNVGAHNHLGQLYYNQGNYAEAGGQFKLSVETRPTVWGYSGVAIVDWQRGNRAGALENFHWAEELDPTDSRPYLLLGVLESAAGNTADAIRQFKHSLKVDPGNAVARAQLARLKKSQK